MTDDADVMKMGVWIRLNKGFKNRPELFVYWVFLCVVSSFAQIYFFMVLIKEEIMGMAINFSKNSSKIAQEETNSLEYLNLHYCEGFKLDSVIMSFLLSIALVRTLNQKVIIFLGHDIDTISKAFMIIQIIVTALMIPIGTAYIQTIFTFRGLLYCMGGMLLITNMDNFIAELFKL